MCTLLQFCWLLYFALVLCTKAENFVWDTGLSRTGNGVWYFTWRASRSLDCWYSVLRDALWSTAFRTRWPSRYVCVYSGCEIYVPFGDFSAGSGSHLTGVCETALHKFCCFHFYLTYPESLFLIRWFWVATNYCYHKANALYKTSKSPSKWSSYSLHLTLSLSIFS